MKVAVIDMGTNTFHLLLAEVQEEEYAIFHRERKAVKIGERGINNGKITTEARDRAIAALKDYQSIIQQNEIDHMFATATSAIRNASNGKALVEEIKMETGITTEIISGVQEAELILKGVKRALHIGNEKSLIMDIGGGSIEFIIADQNETYWLKSFEMGGQRLIEMFRNPGPISENEEEELHHFFQAQLEELHSACRKHAPHVLIGCSGTFDTLSDIYCEEYRIQRAPNVTELPFSMEAFPKILHKLTTKTRAERLKIPGMTEMRVDMIVVACVLIDYLIGTLEIQNIRVSAYALKEGVLHTVWDKVKNPVS